MINLNDFKKQVNELIFYLNEDGARTLLKRISKADELFIKENDEIYKAFISLRFLALPFLSTWEIFELFKEHISIGLGISDIDLPERIKRKLVFINMLDRDNCKKALRDALIKNNEIITKEVESEDKKKLKIIADWLKDYVSYTGVKGGHSLQRAQYFQKSYFRNLDEREREILKKLFSLYNFLNTSSFTPEGFEDDLLLKTVDGKLITTNKGQVVVLYDPKKEKEKSSAINNSKNLFVLKALLANYPPNSLERKAVEEEIKKMNNEL